MFIPQTYIITHLGFKVEKLKKLSQCLYNNYLAQFKPDIKHDTIMNWIICETIVLPRHRMDQLL